MGIYRVPVNLTWAGSGSPGVNVWHVRAVVGGTGTENQDLQSAVDAIHTFYSSLLNIGSASSIVFPASMKATLGQVVNVEDDTERTPTWADIPAAGSVEMGPTAAAIVVGWRTSLVGRRGRGRTFLGPVNRNVIDTDGTPTPAVLTNIRTAATTLLDASTGNNGWAVGVWGQLDEMPGKNVTPAERLAAPHVIRDITGFSVRDQFAVLRSRRD